MYEKFSFKRRRKEKLLTYKVNSLRLESIGRLERFGAALRWTWCLRRALIALIENVIKNLFMFVV